MFKFDLIHLILTHTTPQQDNNYYNLLNEAKVEDDNATVCISNRSDQTYCTELPPPTILPTTVPGMVPLPTIEIDTKINPASRSMAT